MVTPVPADLLGGHVAWGPCDVLGLLVLPRRIARIEDMRDPEISELRARDHPLAQDQNVRWFDVTVDDLAGVRVRERGEQIPQDLAGLIPTVYTTCGLERTIRDVLHHEVWGPFDELQALVLVRDDPFIIDPHDVRV